jgi:hypothetical protein
MRDRAKRFGGRLEVWSELGAGTDHSPRTFLLR